MKIYEANFLYLSDGIQLKTKLIEWKIYALKLYIEKLIEWNLYTDHVGELNRIKIFDEHSEIAIFELAYLLNCYIRNLKIELSNQER